MKLAMRPWLAVAIAGAGLLSAVASGMNAGALALATQTPDLSLKLADSTPKPLERLAIAAIRLDEGATGQASADFSAAQSLAREALDRSLLSPTALAILAWDAPADRKARLLAAGSALSRRDSLMQSALLQQAIATDSSGTVLRTVDDLLRVNPTAAADIAPSLIALLRDDDNIPAFVALLSAAPPWGENFLVTSSREPELGRNLTKLRLALPRTAKIDPQTDRMIIDNLVREGSLKEALALHRRVEGGLALASVGPVDWRTEYPPFDWKLADDYDAYARIRENGGLSVQIRSGHGGELASRLIALPDTAGEVRIEHTLKPVSRLNQVGVAIRCGGTADKLFSAKFASGPVILPFPVASERPCDAYLLVISGRAFGTDPTIEGTIDSVNILAAGSR